MSKKHSFFSAPSNGIFVGVIFGCVAIGLLMYFRFPEVSKAEQDVVLPTEGAAAELVDAWQRMRTETWAVDATFTRTTADGRTFSTSIREAQRPPERIRVSSAGVEAILNGARYACSIPAEEAESDCREGESVEYSEVVEAEVNNLRKQLSGSNRLYDVDKAGPGCFDLFARPGHEAATWGSRATLCFDPATGAPARSEFQKEGAVDVVQAVSIRPDVTDEELRLPGPPSASR